MFLKPRRNKNDENAEKEIGELKQRVKRADKNSGILGKLGLRHSNGKPHKERIALAGLTGLAGSHT